jgi:hypothetical protein
VKDKHWALLIGYLIGSFFGLTQLLGLFGGLNRTTAAAV